MEKIFCAYKFLLLAIIQLIFFLTVSVASAHDVNGDGKEGLSEAIHALQVVAGIIVTEDTDQKCSDGKDNDGDGFIDCDDFDCNSIAPCVEDEDTDQKCSDGNDNDGDGYIDCDDYDCIGKAPCLQDENTTQKCSDGNDNDGDGFIDCDDFDCTGIASCP